MERERAIALWRLATLMRMNQDRQLWAVADQIDQQAIRYAKAAGIEYATVAAEVENGHEITAIAD